MLVNFATACTHQMWENKMKTNCTTIRVWFCKADGGANVGHATLQTPNEYLSLWPNRDTKAKTGCGMLFEHRSGAYFCSCYEEDLDKEQRPAEYVCLLYSLSVSKIDKKIRELKSETTQWSTAGNTFFGNWTAGVSRSCAGAVREALMAGDMNVLAAPGIATNLMTSPHNIFTWARDAKEAELKKYPQTKEYDISQGYKHDPHHEVSRMAIVQGCRVIVGGGNKI